MGGLRWVVVISVVVLLAACDGGGGSAPEARTGPVSSVGRKNDVSVRLALDHASVPSGGTLKGTVTIDNPTGAPLELTKCGDPFMVWLGRQGVWPDVVRPLCAQPFTVPTGRSASPVQLQAVWPSCRSGKEPAFVPPCDQEPPPTEPPRLIPGRYLARLYDGTGIGVVPPDIPVTVIAAK